ncbi:MAG: aspartate/glutamate racemase family protein [Bacillota bacterium]
MRGRCNIKEIIFYDSGIGGIALLNKTREKARKESYIYFADNENMPYGNKTQNEITAHVIKNLESVVKTTTKCVVIACNTITTKSISEIRRVFPETKIFGIEPEIKSALKPRIKNALLIATPKTCESAKEKLDILDTQNKITIHPAPNLAKTIEEKIGDKEAIYREIKKIKRAYPQKFQSLILGCTHYALVRDVFCYAFSEETKIFDGINGTACNIAKSIQKEKIGFGSVKLVMTKENTKEKLKYVSLIN